MRTNETRRESLAAEIRAECARQVISQAKLSAATGITLSTLRSRLQGIQPFWVDELDTIAQFLGVPLSELIARSDRAEV